MAICSRCKQGFDTEDSSHCPSCGAYWSPYHRSGTPVGSGLTWSIAAPFVLGILLSLLFREISVVFLGILGSFFCLYIWSILWSYADGKARGKSGCLVAFLVAFLSWPLGLILWITFRP